MTHTDLTDTAIQSLPTPVGYRMLIEPIQSDKVTKGGIVLVDESKQYADAANSVGRVLKQGESCYQGGKFSSPWCKPGDYVLYARHVGQRIEWREQDGESKTYLLINDDDVRAVVADPGRVKSYI